MSEYKRLRIRICHAQKEEPFCFLTLPEHVTFLQLHAALEILLQREGGDPFGFLLMTQRRAIDAHLAEKCEVAEAFAQNSGIRYFCPYPGNPVLKLELERVTESAEALLCAQAEAAEGGELPGVGELLEKYTAFGAGWKYRPVSAAEYRPVPAAESGKGGRSAPEKVVSGRRGGTMRERLEKLDELVRGHEEEYAVSLVVGESGYTQEELLGAYTKNSLLALCSLTGLPVPGNSTKKGIAGRVGAHFSEEPGLYFLLFPENGIFVLQRLCAAKNGKREELSFEELVAVSVMLKLGLADLARLEDDGPEPVFELQIVKGVREEIASFFRKKKKFDVSGLPVSGVVFTKKSPDLYAVCRAYEELDGHVEDFLLYYGSLGVDSLRGHLAECYGYALTESEFLLYLRLRMVFHGQAVLYAENPDGPLFIAPARFDGEAAGRAVRRFGIRAAEKPVDAEAMETFLAETEEIREGMVLLLADLEMDVDDIEDFLVSLTVQVAQNCSWEEFTGEAEEIAADLDSMKALAWWFQMSRFYLNLPLSGLGGQSRIAYAQADGENPYAVFSDVPEYASDAKEESMFLHTYAAQWELYQACERLIEDGENELCEKQMLRCAKRYLSKEDAETLQCYCYLVSGNPKLIDAIGNGMENGNEAAAFLMNDLMAFLEEMNLSDDGDFPDPGDLPFSLEPDIVSPVAEEKVDVIVPFPQSMFPLGGIQKTPPQGPRGGGKKKK